jgi:anti-anti-sigma regulatory factor
MEMIAEWLKIDEERVVEGLRDASEKLDGAAGEVVLDFSSVRRIDAGAIRAMEEFAALTDQKAVRAVLCGVKVDVYKVLKLVKLASRFSFITPRGQSSGDELESCYAAPSSK